MEKRLIAFMVLAFLCIMVNFWFTSKFVKPPARAVAEKKPDDAPKADKAKPDVAKPDAAKPDTAKTAPKVAAKADKAAPIVAPGETLPEQWATLGSADPASDYRMLVTLTNRGAAVERIELNSPRYRDVEDWEDRSG